MLFKVQAAMASGLRSDETKPRRFDLSMSRRTRRPAAANLATSSHEQDHHQAMDVEGSGFQPVVVQPEDAHQEHDASEQRSEETTQEQQQQQQQPEEECQDNSRRFSLQELIEDEAVDDDVKEKDAATGGTEENAAAAAVAAREVAEGAAAEGEAKRSDQVAGRRVIGIMRRYVKVRSIKSKRASPEKDATPVC